jgi:DnaJ-class molecular chaperone
MVTKLDHIGQGDVVVKKICTVCNGNGFVRVPFEQAREEQWADCDFCNNQGEIAVDRDWETIT